MTEEEKEQVEQIDLDKLMANMPMIDMENDDEVEKRIKGGPMRGRAWSYLARLKKRSSRRFLPTTESQLGLQYCLGQLVWWPTMLDSINPRIDPKKAKESDDIVMAGTSLDTTAPLVGEAARMTGPPANAYYSLEASFLKGDHVSQKA
ncbi:hypothetical protein CDV31_012860 [Fusarium ambrosium]|uniref:Uncharacterized protein n=1 Tax=Fusarium ambrosium TaxID=131363 RepID=A0A428T730_9HYPO|nr:hypothetical protein CDV31_012860 [Fusarium ambrosium]